MTRQLIWIGIGAVLGGLFLWWSLGLVSVGDVLAIVRNAAPLYLVLTVVLSVAFIAVKTLRWKLLLRPLAPVTFNELHAPVYIGTAANLMISHAGELLRARLLSSGRHALPTGTVLASIGLERILDLFAMLLLIAYLFANERQEFGSILTSVADTTALLAGTAAIVVMSMVLKSEAWLRGLARLSQWLPTRQGAWLQQQLSALIGGFRSINDPILLAKALAASVLQWSLIALSIWCCAKSIDIGIDLISAVLVLVVLVFGLTLPTAPGYLGTTQVAFIAALAVFEVPESSAFAASVLYSAFLVLPSFLIGAVCMLCRFVEHRSGVRLYSTG